MPASQPNSVPVAPVSESASFQLELMYLQKFLEMMGETVTTIGSLSKPGQQRQRWISLIVSLTMLSWFPMQAPFVALSGSPIDSVFTILY